MPRINSLLQFIFYFTFFIAANAQTTHNQQYPSVVLKINILTVVLSLSPSFLQHHANDNSFLKGYSVTKIMGWSQ